MTAEQRRHDPILPPGRYLVTGATGLVGSHVLARLAGAAGIEVTATYHRRAPNSVDDGVSWHQVDLTDAAACAAVMAGHDYVIHAAGVVAPAPVLARDPVGPVRRNVAVTQTVLEAAWRAGVRRLVWFSSTTGYPESDSQLDENQMFDGDPPAVWFGMGWAHRYLETQSRMYATCLKPAMDVVTLRPSLIYGPRPDFGDQSSHFVFAFVRRVVERENPLEIWGDGSQRRDLIHAADVAQAAACAVARGSGYAAYNIAAGESVTTRAVLDMLTRIDGWTDPDIRYDTTKPASAGNRTFAIERAASELGFRPRVTLADGLRDLVADYRAQNHAERRQQA